MHGLRAENPHLTTQAEIRCGKNANLAHSGIGGPGVAAEGDATGQVIGYQANHGDWRQKFPETVWGDDEELITRLKAMVENLETHQTDILYLVHKLRTDEVKPVYMRNKHLFIHQ